ncbi:glycogen synthase [Candidatus Margulisiibacteriota bacterium]
MKILFLASEVVPFAKTGGLADVAAALPKAIRQIGHDIRIFMPRYKCVDTNIKSEVPIYFFEDERFANREELYCIAGKDYPDNREAFMAYCQAVDPLLKQLDWTPDIIHGNDWQTGPAVTVRPSARTATVFSIHNIAYQGEFKDRCFMKDGIESADVINTVSETYAKEIQTKEYGCGLEEILQQRSKDIYGIVNGVDYEIWNPATDRNLVKRFSKATLSLRSQNKAALQKEIGLPQDEKIPVIGIVSRLDVQKGFDILLEAIDDLMQLNVQLIVLGAGDPRYHRLLGNAQKKYKDRIGLKLGFDNALAHRIYAGSDMFLMPSKYEPCGLGQLISFKYGTIPIVRETGGLADTVRDNQNGFVFKEYSAEALVEAVGRAVEAYKATTNWQKMQNKVMDYNYSWDASAKKYISLYAKALDKVIK